MGLFGRRTGRRRAPLPDSAREVLGLGKGVRILAWASLVGGGWAAASAEGLRALLPTGALVNRPWTDVDHVAWHQDSRMLAVWWIGSRQPVPVEIEEGSYLPEVVYERVRASVVLSTDVEVPGGRSVRVALRKAPDGRLFTQVVPGKGVRVSDPGVTALVERTRAQLRDEAGLSAEADRPEPGPEQRA